jgi:linoleoyl-CoA desaturase
MAVESASARWEQFSELLSQRVDQYFTSHAVQRNADTYMIAKIVFGFSYFAVTYLALAVSPPSIGFYFAYLLHGTAHLFLLLNVGHDANHSALSRRRWINRLLSYTMDLCGISSRVWRITHHRFHHYCMNTYGQDEAVSGRGLFRFSPHAPRRIFHRFQHFYAPATYFLVSLDWIFIKDFQYSLCRRPDGFPVGRASAMQLVQLLSFKMFYIGYMIVVPVLVFDHSVVSVVSAFALSHAVIGIAALVLFQTAHVLEGSHFPSGKADLKNHVQLTFETTVDCAPRSRLLSWLSGGLNTHVIHHLYPGICHTHYRSLSEIIRLSASECGIPYREYPTMLIPVSKHLKLLKRLATSN